MRSRWWDIAASAVKWVDRGTRGCAIAKLEGKTLRGWPLILRHRRALRLAHPIVVGYKRQPCMPFLSQQSSWHWPRPG